MMHRLIRALWGDFSREEFKKFGLLSLGFFILIGSFWPLKIIKDVIFINMVGSAHQPTAKILSLIIFFPLVLIFSRLVDYFSKERLIYFFVALFGGIGLLFAYLFSDPVIGVANMSQGTGRILGWAFYLFAESYISIMVSLYWAFINDVTTPESAKKGYGFLIFGSQLGAVVFISVGNFLSRDASLYATRIPIIAFMSVIAFFFLAVVVFILTRVVKKEEMIGYSGGSSVEKESVGFWDGLKVLLKFPYVSGIFGMVFLHEVATALMHYQMLRTVEFTYIANGGQGLVSRFMFDFTLVMQGISCLFALFGTSYFQRKLGVRGCLIAYPLLLGIGIVLFLFNPTLIFITGVIVIAKGINYVLNQPAKEMLYIPTTRAIKYKAKAWIDMFGLRSAKMSGALVNKTIGIASRVAGGFSLVIVVFWLILARSIGHKYNKVVEKGDRIGL